MAVRMLRDCIGSRPDRGRKAGTIIAGDVRRARKAAHSTSSPIATTTNTEAIRQSSSYWETNGNVRILGFFSHLLEGEVGKIVNDSFEIYRYYCRDHYAGRVRKGWVRTQVHSLPQQAMRYDLGAYALHYALRWRNKENSGTDPRPLELVSYPYYVKNTEAYEPVAFRHIDINVGRALETGRGLKSVQAAISLDDETEDNYTVLVQGFYNHIEQ
ncbi:MAG: hypothetical protein M1833_001711 [Piccolia ochrophora]|nr:MAG: hypothetical protein M1833_001711 [Piccolia ochrophora]